MKIYFIVAVLIFLPISSFAEFVFVKNGSIIEGKIIKQNDNITIIRNKNGKKTSLERNKILRTIFNNDFKNKKFIYKLDGDLVHSHIVYENNASYFCRDNVLINDEYIILKKDINFISKKKVLFKTNGSVKGKILNNADEQIMSRTKRSKVWFSNYVFNNVDVYSEDENFNYLGHFAPYLTINYEYMAMSYFGIGVSGIATHIGPEESEKMDFTLFSSNFFFALHPFDKFLLDPYVGLSISTSIIVGGPTTFGFGYGFIGGANIHFKNNIFVGVSYNYNLIALVVLPTTKEATVKSNVLQVQVGFLF